MTSIRMCLLALVCITLGTARAAAQEKRAHYQFRVWQFLPDSSRTSPGGMWGAGARDEDFHMFIALGSGSGPLAPAVRLDGDFVVHQLKDSTLLVGDITATRLLSRDSTGLFARDFTGQDRLERRTYRLRTRTTRGSAVWFYPFGVPRRGERGIAFELSSSDTEPVDATHRTPSNYESPPGAAPISYGIDGLTRPHRARVRVEVGDRTFEDDVLTRVPVRIALKSGARGQDLMFELEAQDPAGGRPIEMCWRWFWADERPPGGSGCGSFIPGIRGETVEQSLDGSAGLKLRVTLLSAS